MARLFFFSLKKKKSTGPPLTHLSWLNTPRKINKNLVSREKHLTSWGSVILLCFVRRPWSDLWVSERMPSHAAGRPKGQGPSVYQDGSSYPLWPTRPLSWCQHEGLGPPQRPSSAAWPRSPSSPSFLDLGLGLCQSSHYRARRQAGRQLHTGPQPSVAGTVKCPQTELDETEEKLTVLKAWWQPWSP